MERNGRWTGRGLLNFLSRIALAFRSVVRTNTGYVVRSSQWNERLVGRLSRQPSVSRRAQRFPVEVVGLVLTFGGDVVVENRLQFVADRDVSLALVPFFSGVPRARRFLNFSRAPSS